MGIINALAKNFTPQARSEQWDNLLEFAKNAKVETGFGYLLDDATVSTEKPVELWITCRMVHVFSLAALKEKKQPTPDETKITTWENLATHGIYCLNNYFHDHEHGGWYSAISPQTNKEKTSAKTDKTAQTITVVDETKAAYAHAFVVLAASSATIAGIAGASQLLDHALETQETRWWDEKHQKVKESYNRDFSKTEAYRGVNANMHTVECYLAAFDATAERKWLNRALQILKWVLDEEARANNWRITEHYDENWQALPEYNIDRPTDPFRPYGHTPGHGLEWGRLALHAGAELERLNEPAPKWILECADQVIERAITDGWHADGEPGFVYTTSETGEPVAKERMHWVLCEAIGAATTLAEAIVEKQARELAGVEREKGELEGVMGGSDLDLGASNLESDVSDLDSGASNLPMEKTRARSSLSQARINLLVERIDNWWAYAEKYLIATPGQWRHELDAKNQPSAVTWGGKPDAYHVAQMLLLPDLKLAPTFALGILS
ncbi:AGE family epimerase/isomerase [Gleimia sp. 6138-11-ORH1]|uniref:AGE family epimerase/isomerase n=1 Tax=Gleimia sp. 6138-11-ORH1 TaxID=2973937 RepID=UPI0021674B27|nr:AGE family epimerase/isomerase [Gleimia sp. 6138-11-ORH1]MCS4483915.1 AGE family epimerase/isomerase [Gleimia sp. 6138-11-ORH1]